MTAAAAFSEREHMVVKVARDIEDGANYWVAGGGGPLYAVLLADRLGYAKEAQYITEDGVIAPEAELPFQAMGSMMSSRAGYRAAHWGTMNTAGDHAQLGYMDYGILNTLQVDQHGNINSTVLGSYEEWTRRYGGPGGAQTIAAQCWRTILMTDQQKRKFVNRVDFISSPGFLDGTEGARERAGLPAGTGPWRVYTPWATYDYEERKLRLIERSPWVTVDDILEECECKPLLAPEIGVSEPPTDEELGVYRTELDVRGQTMDRGTWVIKQDDGTYQRQEMGA
ncbi:MAG: CoA-transferase [Dehalococcoidia bacterium]|jgi:glutaconate CoA-transferase subunit B|nr:CoA-transferase [Dehalococcoidia bacterium]